MVKARSFAQKARKAAKREAKFHMVKFVKSVVSEKTGKYRFQETMLKVPTGMTLDAYLQQLEEQERGAQEEPLEESQERKSDGMRGVAGERLEDSPGTSGAEHATAQAKESEKESTVAIESAQAIPGDKQAGEGGTGQEAEQAAAKEKDSAEGN